MPQFRYTKGFKKNLKRMETNQAAMASLEVALRHLLNSEPLPASFRDHRLIGNLSNCRECHLRPDVLLLYEIAGEIIILHRLGSHADLFSN